MIEGNADINVITLSLDIHGPKIDVGIDIKKPKLDIPGIGLDIHGPEIRGGIGLPELDIHGPKIDDGIDIRVPNLTKVFKYLIINNIFYLFIFNKN